VNQVGGRTQIARQVDAVLEELHDLWRGAIPELSDQQQRPPDVTEQLFESATSREATHLADQLVDSIIFAESADTWCENEQLATVRDRHSGAVHRLVPEPRGVELGGVEVRDHLREPS
jgi:hypothetical protein